MTSCLGVNTTTVTSQDEAGITVHPHDMPQHIDACRCGLQVSPALAKACEDCDLVILEGMGRAIETNLNAQFSCSALRLGMIKHPEVAQCLNGRLYDVVCKFTRGSAI